jgi:hypothetical protein
LLANFLADSGPFCQPKCGPIQAILAKQFNILSTIIGLPWGVIWGCEHSRKSGSSRLPRFPWTRAGAHTVMRGLDPRIHDETQQSQAVLFTRSDPSWIASELGLARVLHKLTAASRVNPTCSVKPGNDGREISDL